MQQDRERLPMVGWFDPPQLVRTALEVMVSTALGRHSDRRLIEALTTAEPLEPFDCEAQMDLPAGEFWVDYISDTGDGWDSTYAVAATAALPTLDLADSHARTHTTARGNVLILGGDQVYPIAARHEYQRRFVAPFAAAFPDRRPPLRKRPKMFAVPGNHDWYDSLASFTRLFCQNRNIGGWHAPQRRSYFAVKLPSGWWLLGTDVQLAADIDQPQVDFFRRVADRFQSGDRVILCNADPHWINAAIYGGHDPEYNENNLRFLETQVLKGRVAVFLAGDLHHYRRHEGPKKVQKITAGGGGAFLHPTHPDDAVRVLKEHDERGREFVLKQSFPTIQESKRLTWGNLAFLFHNPSFGLLTAVLYVFISGSVGAFADGWDLFTRIVTTPLASIVVSFALLGYVLFTDTHDTRYKVIGGALHGAANITASFVVSWWVRELIPDMREPLDTLLVALFTFLGGWVVGPTIMGLYLLISLNVFGRHANEAFSALAIPHFKNFLRLRIASDGTLTIFPIGLRQVPRKWKDNPDRSGPELVSDDPSATPPQLIEDPIVLR
ncbi:MAG: metallophosphoesterase [Bryobacteraceae bacterium]